MSENRDEATGQFTAPSELPTLPLDGLVPYEPETDASQDDAALTLDEAKAKLDEIQGTDEGDIETFSPVSDLAENVTLTLEQATEILGKEETAEAEKAEEAENEKIREEVDKLREADQQPEPEITVERALELPQVKEAIEKVTRETVEAREKHVSGLAAATQIAEHSVLSKYPELANVAPEQRLNAFAAIAHNDPERAAAIQADIASLANVFSQYSAESERLIVEREAQVQQRTREIDAKFAEKLKDVPQAKRAAIEQSVVSAIKELGAPPEAVEQILKAGERNEYVRDMLWHWGSAVHQLSEIRNAPKTVVKPTLPPVQRPGYAGAARKSAATSDLAALDRRLAQTGSVEDAWALFQARTKAKG